MRFARSDKVKIFTKLCLHLPGMHCQKRCELGECFRNTSGDEKPKQFLCTQLWMGLNFLTMQEKMDYHYLSLPNI